VKFNEGHEVAWSELVEWARPKLATYQLPHYYRPIDVFELTPSERIRKHLLPRGIHGAWKRPH
jgi:crotonobetaine/carnitine-CoA ligase